MIGVRPVENNLILSVEFDGSYGLQAKKVLAFSRIFRILTSTDALVAQLDRASVYGTEGYRFESYRVHSND